MKILYAYQTEGEKEYAAGKLAGHEVVFHAGPLQEGELWNGAGVQAISIFVNSPVGVAELDRLPDLKLVTTRSTGFDHVDIEAAKARGITVLSVPAYGEHTVAEFVFALLFTISRKLFSAHETVLKDGSFDPKSFTGFDLWGKTLGVLGTGRIGKNVIKIAKGFGLKILAFDLYPDQAFATAEAITYTSLDEIYAQADIITLHLPGSKETEKVINEQAINKFKKGMIVINTARGSLIDTEALVKGLREGIIAGAGLDVLAEEGNVADEMHLLASPHPKAEDLKTLLLNHYLINHPKVVITPHMAFNTVEALQRILDTTIENLNNFKL